MDQQTLVKQAGVIADVAAKAQEWVDQNRTRVSSGTQSVEDIQANLRRQARLARRLGRAAERKMCAGVFGPSQAGKSYLLSSLARDEYGDVLVKFGNETHDFLKEINPYGGKESTGLVTRFTLTPAANLPDGFPVHVRLFSETELVKIFANSYFRDCKHKGKIDKDAIRNEVEGMKGKVGTASAPHLDLDAMEDLREYINSCAENAGRAIILDELYWPEAIHMAPKMPLEDRAKLYGVIWDNIPEFTAMFLSLARDLERLGNPDEAFCEMSALLPNTASIIDVETLGKDDFSSLGVANEVKIKGKNGQVANITRKNATAIVAELILVMCAKPAPYFDHTDLLDFPGYKARLECSDIREYLGDDAKDGKKENKVEQFFRRGKVDYLFQRYNAENELTSLLLCVATTDQTPGLASAVSEWIASTHGETPEARRAYARTALFYILTKADRYFEKKPGSLTELWKSVIIGNFLAHFGGVFTGKTNWVEQWEPNRPFQNLFLLRNINIPFDAVMRYQDKQGVQVEMGVQEDKQARVAELREAFINTPEVKKYFSSPGEAFDELMKVNDGGMGHIKNRLGPLCDPDLKLAQVAQGLAGVAQSVIAILSPFYHSGDQEQELKKKMAFFAGFGRLFKNPYFQERFPELLSNFKVAPEILFYLRPEAERKYEEYRQEQLKAMLAEVQEQPEPVVAEPEGDPLDFLDDVFNDPAPVQAAQGGGAKPGESKDEHHFYARRIIESWDERMRRLAETPECQNYYQFSKPVFLGMLDEFGQAVARLQVQAKLEKKFREIAEPVDVSRESKIRKQAAYAIGVLNDFVSWLGKKPSDTEPAQRSVNYRGEDVMVFRDRPPVQEYPVLPETFVPFSRQWYKDWLTAFYGMLVDNVTYTDGAQIDMEQNRRLGDLIKQLNGENASA